MPFTTYSRSKITSIKGSYGCPRWFDAVYNSDLEYIRKHSKNINKVRQIKIFEKIIDKSCSPSLKSWSRQNPVSVQPSLTVPLFSIVHQYLVPRPRSVATLGSILDSQLS